MLYATQDELNKYMERLEENVPPCVCCAYETRPGEQVELVAVRVGLCNTPAELLALECQAPNAIINMCGLEYKGQEYKAEIYRRGKLVGGEWIKDIDTMMRMALEEAKALCEMQEPLPTPEIQD